MRGSKADLPVTMETEKVVNQGGEWDDLNVTFGTYKERFDATPFLKGLPEDRCQCPHWGYVIRGQMRVQYKDHEEVINAGDAFYVKPGHTMVMEAGTELVQFSPKELIQKSMEVMARNLEALKGDK